MGIPFAILKAEYAASSSTVVHRQSRSHKTRTNSSPTVFFAHDYPTYFVDTIDVLPKRDPMQKAPAAPLMNATAIRGVASFFSVTADDGDGPN